MLAAEASAAEELRSLMSTESTFQQQSDNTSGVLTAISRALRTFGELPLEGTGALAQAWMPVSTPEGSGTVLQTKVRFTCYSSLKPQDSSKSSGRISDLKLRHCRLFDEELKGLPYCLIGPGDMLALFRCLSCKYSFSSDLKQLGLMGAPGRVFTSGEAETSDNVQQCNVSIYLRVRDAQACRVSSTVLLPVFAEPSRKNAVAVLEVTQFNGAGFSYQTVFEWARTHLEAAGLFTPKQLETRTFEMQSHALSIRFFSSRDSALGCIFNDNGPAGAREAGNRDRAVASVSLGQEIEGQAIQEADTEAKEMQGNNSNSGDNSGMESDDERNEENRHGDERNEEESRPGGPTGLAEDDQWEPKSSTGGQSKAGLSKEDLERHFGLGLKEAAIQLGVCNTTLKRACRRHGIMKWPRRELLKAAKAQKDSAKKKLLATSDVVGQTPERPLRLQPVPGGLLSLGRQATGSPADSASLGSMIATARQMPSNLTPLPHAGSPSLMPGFPSPPSFSTPQTSPITQPPRAVLSVEDPTSFAPLCEDLPGFGSWKPPGQLANNRLAGAQCITENDSSRRSSLGFIDAIFSNEGEPPGLGSVLGEEWEQELTTFRQAGDGPRAMEVVSEGNEGRSPGATTEGAGNSHLQRFPEVPEPWQLE